MTERESFSQKVIRKHYGLERQVTFEEVAAERENLLRKRAAGTLDYRQERLAAALKLFD